MHYKTLCKPWLKFLAAQLFLNCITAIAWVIIDVRYKNLGCISLVKVTKQVGRYEDGKNIFSKNLQIKTYTDNILK